MSEPIDKPITGNPPTSYEMLYRLMKGCDPPSKISDFGMTADKVAAYQRQSPKINKEQNLVQSEE